MLFALYNQNLTFHISSYITIEDSIELSFLKHNHRLHFKTFSSTKYVIDYINSLNIPIRPYCLKYLILLIPITRKNLHNYTRIDDIIEYSIM